MANNCIALYWPTKFRFNDPNRTEKTFWDVWGPENSM
jgi:hypothetical protein